LAELLKKVLDEYTKAHPSTTKGEIRAALRLTQAGTGGPRAGLALSITAGVLMAGGVAGFLASRAGDGLAYRSYLPAVVMAVIFLLAIVLIVVRVRSD
jgi:hypothetical protein